MKKYAKATRQHFGKTENTRLLQLPVPQDAGGTGTFSFLPFFSMMPYQRTGAAHGHRWLVPAHHQCRQPVPKRADVPCQRCISGDVAANIPDMFRGAYPAAFRDQYGTNRMLNYQTTH